MGRQPAAEKPAAEKPAAEKPAAEKAAKPEAKKFPLRIAKGKSMTWGRKMLGEGDEVKLAMLGADEKSQNERLAALVERGVIVKK